MSQDCTTQENPDVLNLCGPQLGRVIVGQHSLLDEVLLALVAGGHVLLEGVPGLGKTVLVKTLADSTGLTFSRVQFTPDLMPARHHRFHHLRGNRNGTRVQVSKRTHFPFPGAG